MSEAPLARRVATNTAVGVAGKALALGVGAASVVVLTRYLGAADYGGMTLALTYMQMFGVVADAGLYNIVVREASRRPERAAELVGNVLTLRLLLSVAVIAAATGISLFLPYEPRVRVAILIAGAPLLLGMLNGSVVALFQAELRMQRAVIAEAIGRVAAFAAAATAAAMDLGFYAVVSTAALGALVTAAVTFSLSRATVSLRPRFETRIWRELLRASLPLGLALALNELYFRADALIISFYRPFEEVGSYALAYRVLELVVALPAVFLGSYFAVVSRFADAADERLRRTVQAGTDFYVLVAAPIAAGGLVLAPEIVEIAGGEGFGDATTPLRLLLFAGGLALVNGLFGYCLVALGRQAQALWLNVAGLAVNVGLNLWLVPKHGIDAAAAVTLGCEVGILAGSWHLMRRHAGFFPHFGRALRAAVAAAAMAAVLTVLDWSAWALVPLGAALYGALVLAIGAFDRDELRALRA